MAATRQAGRHLGGTTVPLGGRLGEARLIRLSEHEAVLQGPEGLTRLYLTPDVKKQMIVLPAASAKKSRQGKDLMSRNVIVALSGLLLAACSGEPVRRADTFDRIGQELEAWKNARRVLADAVGQAMLLPLLQEVQPAAKPEPRFNLAVNTPVTQVLTAVVSGTPTACCFRRMSAARSA